MGAVFCFAMVAGCLFCGLAVGTINNGSMQHAACVLSRSPVFGDLTVEIFQPIGRLVRPTDTEMLKIAIQCCSFGAVGLVGHLTCNP